MTLEERSVRGIVSRVVQFNGFMFWFDSDIPIELRRTSLGRMVQVLLDNAVGLGEADVRERVFWIREMLVLGEEVDGDDRAFLCRLAWIQRHLLPPELVVYAAIGGGVCGEE